MILDLIKRLPRPAEIKTEMPSKLLQVPKYALKPINLLPDGVQQDLISKLLSKVLSQALAEEELTFLKQHWLHIEVTDVPFQFYISVSEDNSLLLQKTLKQEADVRFAGDTQSMLLLMSRSVDPDTLFFQRKLLVTGDTELGLEIKNFLDDMDLDSLPKVLNLGLQKYAQLTTKPLIKT